MVILAIVVIGSIIFIEFTKHHNAGCGNAAGLAFAVLVIAIIIALMSGMQ
jgi:hypothetical protein